MLHSNNENTILKRFSGQEDMLVEKYILNGPRELQNELGLDDSPWSILFNYLVFEHNLIYKCIAHNSDFFMDAYLDKGMAGLREILDITESKYDRVAEVIFDFVAISREALFEHVAKHHDRYVQALKSRGTDFVRKVLGLYKSKYENHWARVLDILLKSVCNDIFSESTLDHGLNAFSRIISGLREQRALHKHKFF